MLNQPTGQHKEEEDRRAFLANCGKFAVTVTPAMCVLLSTSPVSPALAASGGDGTKPDGNNGAGNGAEPKASGNPRVNDAAGPMPDNPGKKDRVDGPPDGIKGSPGKSGGRAIASGKDSSTSGKDGGSKKR